MALLSSADKTDPTLLPTVQIVEYAPDSEQALPFPGSPLSLIPRWPRVLSASTHALIILLSTVILGLAAHTLNGYSGTKGIRFGGVHTSWPEDLNLHPIYIFLTISAMSLIASIPSATLTLRRLKLPAFSPLEVGSTMVSLVILVLWLASDFLQYHSELTPKKDLLSWACRRTSSPTNALVSYQSICEEQIAIKGIAVVITIAHFGIVLSSAVTWHFAVKITKNSATPWRLKG